jgi:antibiotic biosynthesis monooxygenase (ABM) superfamily enzyme
LGLAVWLELGIGVLRAPTRMAVVMVVALTVFFYLVGERGPMLVALAVVPTVTGVAAFWLQTRRSRPQRS